MLIINDSFFHLIIRLRSDLNKYSRKTPARIPFPGADFCDNDNGQEFLLVGKLKKKKKPRPVLISIRGGTGGERAYEVFLDVGQSRIEQWVLIGGAEEDIVGDESFIQQGYPFELRFLLLLSLSLEIIFITLEANRLKSNVSRIRCDQDGWTVQEDMRKESVTTFHKVLNFSPLFTRY